MSEMEVKEDRKKQIRVYPWGVIRNKFRDVYDAPQYMNPCEHETPKAPNLLDLELTNHCNLMCIFCDRQIMTREQGYMDFDLFKKIIDEAADIGVKGIRFLRWGEPYMHPKIFDAIKYVKDNGMLVHVTSNGLLWNSETIEKVLELGVDTQIFSFQGLTKEEYTKLRDNPHYDKLVATIKELIEKRNERKLTAPFVQATTTVLDETPEECEEWSKKWEKIVDSATWGLTSLHRVKSIDRVKPFLARENCPERPVEKLCTEVHVKLAICWNGDVTACEDDYDTTMFLGNVNDMSIMNLWTCKKEQTYREILKAGRRDRIPFCSQHCRNRF